MTHTLTQKNRCSERQICRSTTKVEQSSRGNDNTRNRHTKGNDGGGGGGGGGSGNGDDGGSSASAILACQAEVKALASNEGEGVLDPLDTVDTEAPPPTPAATKEVVAPPPPSTTAKTLQAVSNAKNAASAMMNVVRDGLHASEENRVDYNSRLATSKTLVAWTPKRTSSVLADDW